MPSLLKLNRLATNLQELHAVSQSNDPYQELVPTLFGHKFYAAKSPIGQSLNHAYQHFDQFGPSWREAKIQHTMEKTHQLYAHFLQKAEEQNAILLHCYQLRSQGQAFDPTAQRTAKAFLTKWNTATAPFLTSLHHNKNLRYQAFLTKGFIDAKGVRCMPSLFMAGSPSIVSHQYITDLEGLLQEPLPLQTLYKASIDQALSEKESRCLQELAIHIQQQNEKITIRRFDLGVRALGQLFETVRPTMVADFVKFSALLAQYQADIFNQPDPQHLRWRAKLQPGDHLTCHGIDIILGESIGRKDEEFDNQLVFDIANAPDHVLYIGINRLALPVKSCLAEKINFAIRTPEVIKIAKNGSFAIVEKLYGEPIEWESTTIHLTKADFVKVYPFTRIIYWLIQQNRVFANCHPTYLKVNAKGIIKCIKPTIQLPFSLIMLENVIWTYAHHNPHIFRFIMLKSMLSEHVHARFFKEVAAACLMNNDPDIITRSHILKVKDHRYVDHATILQQEIFAAKAQCLKVMTEKQLPLLLNIEKEIEEGLLHVYTYYAGCSRLPPQIVEEVIAYLSNKPQPIKIASFETQPRKFITIKRRAKPRIKCVDIRASMPNLSNSAS